MSEEERAARHRKAKREYYERNRAEVIARAAAWDKAHPEKKREYRETHREELREARRKHYEKNRQEILAETAAYRAAHPEQTRGYKRKWYERNKDRVIRQAATSAAANPEKERERNRLRRARWRRDHPEESRAKNRQWYLGHLEKAKEIHREWIAAHPENNRQYARNRRSRAYAASGHHTLADIALLMETQNNKCAACSQHLTERGKKNGYHVDHIMPLSRGGSDNPDNLQLLCRACNLSKGNKTPGEWAEFRQGLKSSALAPNQGEA